MHKILSSRIMLSTFIIDNQREDLSYTNGKKTVLMVTVQMHGLKKNTCYCVENLHFLDVNKSLQKW